MSLLRGGRRGGLLLWDKQCGDGEGWVDVYDEFWMLLSSFLSFSDTLSAEHAIGSVVRSSLIPFWHWLLGGNSLYSVAMSPLEKNASSQRSGKGFLR